MASRTQQQTLSFVHKTAATTKAAFVAAKPRRHRREEAVRNHLLVAGNAGMIQHEIAAAMGIPLSSMNSLCNRMRKAGKIFVAGDTRPSPFGVAAKVIRHPQYRGRSQHG